MASYAVILRQCPPDRQTEAASILSRAFSLKDTTCGTILESTPIILIDELDDKQATIIHMLLRPLQACGAILELAASVEPDLPKIEWPKAPLLYKLPIDTWVSALAMHVACPECHASQNLIDFLWHGLNAPPETDGYRPHELANRPGTSRADSAQKPSSSAKQRHPPTRSSARTFTGAAMPEITPFSNPILPPDSNEAPAATPALRDEDVSMRIEELFPDDDGIIPDNNDITNMLDRLLPEEQQRSASGATPTAQNQSSPGSGSYAVFLSKITDDGRRQEVIPLLAEIAGISNEEADKLSRKVIIPVLRGVSQEQAEQAKHRFAQIKVLARVKAG